MTTASSSAVDGFALKRPRCSCGIHLPSQSRTSSVERRFLKGAKTMFDVFDWFEGFAGHLRKGTAGVDLLEALTDSANERMACALAAAHLRSVGRKQCGELFWCRTEWGGHAPGRWDICYGIASARFAGGRRAWDDAWAQRITGDLGVIEAKVSYEWGTTPPDAVGHFLEGELRQRRGYNESEHRLGQQYHGLVCHLRTDGRSPGAAWGGLQNWQWQQVAEMSKAQLETVWPRTDLVDVQLWIGLRGFGA